MISPGDLAAILGAALLAAFGGEAFVKLGPVRAERRELGRDFRLALTTPLLAGDNAYQAGHVLVRVKNHV